MIYDIIDRHFAEQLYLRILFQALFVMSYYGLLRISEVAKSDHTLQARDVHVGWNKCKILLLLYSSKTHGPESLPQKVKITGMDQKCHGNNQFKHPPKHFCPFKLISDYIAIRGNFTNEAEPIFIPSSGIQLEQSLVRNVLHTMISKLGLNASLYTFHSLKAGRAMNLHQWGFPVDQIKQIGRWRSNAVNRYLKS